LDRLRAHDIHVGGIANSRRSHFHGGLFHAGAAAQEFPLELRKTATRFRCPPPRLAHISRADNPELLLTTLRVTARHAIQLHLSI